ncbi:hypothetical protein EJB05_31367 [Eragrostis curvula]|nr:hypothetical protein EJB05_31367 [Eragrostis curvula]
MSRSMSMRSRRDLPPPEKTIEKLENMVDGGNYYEAQQMYKSTSARYIAVQKYSEALDILQSGALVQLKHGQVTCGAELAVMFVDTLIKGGLPYNEENFDRIRRMYEAFPRISVPHFLGDDYDDDGQKLSEAISSAKVRAESCSSFLKAAIRWSAEFGTSKNGSPELHVMLAEYIYSESPETDMTKVSSHFVRGNDPKKFASMLVNFMGKCYPGEDDTAIARGALMYLSQGNLRDANLLMDELKAQLKSADLEFPKTDLIQFIKYLLPTLERDAYPLFRTLRQKYKTSTDRDPVFEELLDEIAAKFYGIQRQNPLEGLFGELFKLASSSASSSKKSKVVQKLSYYTLLERRSCISSSFISLLPVTMHIGIIMSASGCSSLTWFSPAMHGNILITATSV